MTANTRTSLMYLGGCLILFILTLIYMRYQKNKTRERIENNLEYAIGTVNSIVNGNTGRTATLNIWISFSATAKKRDLLPIKGSIRGYEIAEKGDSFLVVYDKIDPENCTMLFNYPIKDSTYFKRYLEEFKTRPLDLSKYF